MSNFLYKYIWTFVGKIYLIQIYSDIRSCWNFHEYHTLQIWSRGPLGCTTQADITLYISHIPDACISSFIPLISPKHPTDITKISPIYPPKYIPQISPGYIIYTPHISHISNIYPKKIPPKYPHRYDDEIEFWSLLRGGGGGLPWAWCREEEEGAEGLFGGDFINRIFTVHLRFV